MAALLGFSERFDVAKYGGHRRAAARSQRHRLAICEPELYTGRHINVAVETSSPLTLGMTVADYWRVTKREANVNYLRDVDAVGFYDPADGASCPDCPKQPFVATRIVTEAETLLLVVTRSEATKRSMRAT